MLNKPKKVDRKMRKLRTQFGVSTPRPGLLEWLTRPIVIAGRWLDVLLLEKRKWYPLPWKQRLRAWRHGFSSFSYNLYELETNPPGDYIPDMQCLLHGFDLNGRYMDAMFSKVVFGRLIASVGAPQPELIGVLLRGYFYPEHGEASEALDGINHLLEQGRKLVLRPSFGGGGTGIFFLERSSAGYQVNGIQASQETFETLIRPLDDYLVTAFVKQAEYAVHIAPGSTNTLRILTLWDVETNQPFVAASCHRFGRASSGPLDGFHAGAGGLSAPIDPDSGELGRAVTVVDGEIKRVSHHPDTGNAIAGVVVPDWRQVVGELLAQAAKFPFAPCVGWDLVKLDEGWVCLEGNPFPGYHVWQVHGGILTDRRARRFYREFGMLK